MADMNRFEDQSKPSLWRRKRLPVSLEARKVVIAHRDRNVALSYESLLQHKGFSIKPVFDLKSTRVLLSEWTPQVVFLDTELVRVNDYEFVRSLTVDQTNDTTLIIAVSLLSSHLSIHTLKDVGFDGHLPRPCTAFDIAEVLAEHFDSPASESGSLIDQSGNGQEKSRSAFQPDERLALGPQPHDEAFAGNIKLRAAAHIEAMRVSSSPRDFSEYTFFIATVAFIAMRHTQGDIVAREWTEKCQQILAIPMTPDHRKNPDHTSPTSPIAWRRATRYRSNVLTSFQLAPGTTINRDFCLATQEAKEASASAIIGYVRTTSENKNIELQVMALKSAGCKIVFGGGIHSASLRYDGFATALAWIDDGDTLMVSQLAGLTSSLMSDVELVDRLGSRGVRFRSLKEGIDTQTAPGMLALTLLAAAAQFERFVHKLAPNEGAESAFEEQ